MAAATKWAAPPWSSGADRLVRRYHTSVNSGSRAHRLSSATATSVETVEPDSEGAAPAGAGLSIGSVTSGLRTTTAIVAAGNTRAVAAARTVPSSAYHPPTTASATASNNSATRSQDKLDVDAGCASAKGEGGGG